MPTISVKLPVRLESRLRQAVVRRRSTRSALVREALDAAGTGAADVMSETFEQLDALLVTLGASGGRS